MERARRHIQVKPHHKGGISSAVASSPAERITRIALLSSAGLILFVFEAYVPRPFPWMKLGLGNITTLLCLYMYGIKDASLVTGVRIFFGGLFSGSFLGPTFILSLGGAIVSLTAMSLVEKRLGRYFSPVGVSVFGALGHNIAQLVLAYLVIIKSVKIIFLLPMFLLSSVGTGAIIGILVYLALGKLEPLYSDGNVAI